MNMLKNNQDKFIVVRAGQRLEGIFSTREEAQMEADKHNHLLESQGQTVDENNRAEVKQLLLG